MGADPGPIPMTAAALTAGEAVRVIRPGDRVFVGSACATPRALLRALEELPVPIPGVTLVHALTDRVGIGAPPRTAYLHRVFYAGRDIRDLASSGLIDYVPISLADVPSDVHRRPPASGRRTRAGRVRPTTTAPAASASPSTSPGRRCWPPACVIAEVNPAMPRTRGDSRIPIDRITHVVDVNTPVIEYVHDPATGVAEQIARYVARLVDDHATLQVGLGRVPDEMLRHLHRRRDLSVHSDVITDAVVDLVDAGVVTGPVVGSWAMGTGASTGDSPPTSASRCTRSSTSATRPSIARPRADGLGDPGLHRRPQRPGLHRTPRRCALRRDLHRSRLPSRRTGGCPRRTP